MSATSLAAQMVEGGMTNPQIIHIAGVTAVWVILLSAVRFAIVGVHGLGPVLRCGWRAAWARHATIRDRRLWLIDALDEQYAKLLVAITTTWSVVLLFLGIAGIGIGLSFGSVGDVAQLVANTPSRWEAFDRGMDLAGAVFLAGGMAAIHAAVTVRRSVSLYISVGFALSGFGIGAITAIQP